MYVVGKNQKDLQMREKDYPQKVRVSIGSAVVLGLAEGKIDAEPTTVYLLTYKRGKCSASCAFCPQSRGSEARADMLSRVVWPVYQVREVVPRIADAYGKGNVRRTCVQALNYPGVLEDILHLVRQIKASSDISISVSCQPLNREAMLRLAGAGAERVSIALDAANEKLFCQVKGAEAGGPYTWEGHFRALKEAIGVFGAGYVTTHLIAGLGETEEDLVKIIQRCVDLGIYPALFAFTPIAGTVMAQRSPPIVDYYRRLQVAHHLITRKVRRYEEMKFEDNHLVNFGLSDEQLRSVIGTGDPFRTSGCPGCNRPYYNESPSGPIYNYPRKPSTEELAEIERVLCP